jgi:hypothetical protein
VPKAKVHSAKVMDYEGIKTLLREADQAFPRLRHLWVVAGYRGEDKGGDWVEKIALSRALASPTCTLRLEGQPHRLAFALPRVANAQVLHYGFKGFQQPIAVALSQL